MISNLAFFPHTDGAYLEGMAQKGGKFYRVSPPKIVALQCIIPSSKGGKNFLVDGREILLSITTHRPDLIPFLFSRHSMSICRDNHLIMDSPVFRKLPFGNFSIRFSYDKDMYTSSLFREKLAFFNKHYILNTNFTIHLPLSEREILVFDNHRHLHGRAAVEGERLFRRVWIQDQDLSSEMISPDDLPYFSSSENSTAALNKYQPYTALNIPKEGKVEKLTTGISLPPELREKLENLLKSCIV